MYHIRLLAEANLLNAIDAQDYYIPRSLTWSGHEFLSAVRDDAVWNKLVQIVEKKGGDVPFEVLYTAAIEFARSGFRIE